jgi:3',5'-cyclic AMP phosphodiesterase CpdA
VRRIAFLCACLFVFGVPGSSAVEKPVAFLAVGDFGIGGLRERKIGHRMQLYEAKRPAQMLVLLGDNDYTRNPSLFRSNWRASFGWARRSGLRVAGVLGNHDYLVGNGRYELGLVGMPSPYYRRRLGDAQLFFLDSNMVSDHQTHWLETALQSSRARWKIAVFHHPPYTCGGHEGDLHVARRWVNLFEEYGVQLVLSGHDHNYQRFAARNGVTYVVNGGGGAGLYPLRGCPSSYPTRVRSRLEHGFLYFTVSADRLDGSAVDLRGRVNDRFTLTP